VTSQGVYWRTRDFGTVDLAGYRGTVADLDPNTGDALVLLDKPLSLSDDPANYPPTRPNLPMSPGFLRKLDVVDMIGELRV